MTTSRIEHTTSLILFRRNLRLRDNLALNQALTESDRVYPAFILDRDLLQRIGAAGRRIHYLISALQQIDRELRALGSQLHVVHDSYAKGIQRLQRACQASNWYSHRDFGTTARRHEDLLEQQLRAQGIHLRLADDISLQPPAMTLKADGTPYTIFTPFFRRAAQLPVEQPKSLQNRHHLARLPAATGDFSLDSALRAAGLSAQADNQPAPGQQTSTLLAQLDTLQDYSTTRDLPALAGTSRLSAALRFGIVSPREVWWAIAARLGPTHPLIRQLYWRDFFHAIGLYFPHVFRGCFHRQYDLLHWHNRADWLQAWREGRTGFPIVDAGMRELLATGYMHNRVRMITASFLVKDLHCDWRLGERHFASQLLDYDPCLNNGNWQWAASTGCDAQPYFRIFNPWTQQQKFDPDCLYIKRWLPELANIPPRTLHQLDKLDHALPGYVKPLVEHGTQAALAKSFFASVAGLKATPATTKNHGKRP